MFIRNLTIVLRLVVLLFAASSMAAEMAELPLWPKGAPGSEGKTDPEVVVTSKSGERRVFQVHNPSITPFLPEAAKASGTAVIVIPGGGHKELQYDPEGIFVARALAEHGIAAFVLKYRLAREPNSTYTIQAHAVPDAQRAIRTVRANAAKWNIDPDKIGAVGFSAGGELVNEASLNFDAGKPDAEDEIERASSKPNFQGLIYPGGSSRILPTTNSPPAFLACGINDRPDISEGLAQVYLRFKAVKVPCELHIYSGTGHAFAYRPTSTTPANGWLARFEEWLEASKLLTRKAQTLDRVTQADFGKAQDGSEVKLITLRNSKSMSAQIITYGAIIKELQAPDRDGNFTNIVLTTDSLEKFQRGFNGAAAIIGRVVNRIGGAQFELDGTTYKLPANDRQNTIHGGRKGFAQSVWTVEDTPIKDNESSVKLSYLSKDGEEGFPGSLKTSVIYSLTDNNELRIDYEAETDKPTIANLTNHAYWNLAGGGSCLDNILWIPSDSYTPANADLIVTGEILPLKGTLMDFNEPTRIGDRIQELKPKMNGYDHNYILGEDKVMKMAARLTEPKSGRIMEVRTTQPAVQLYTGNHLGHTAVCLETQHYPDAIHHPNFPSTVVRPGEPLKETTVFTFSAK